MKKLIVFNLIYIYYIRIFINISSDNFKGNQGNFLNLMRD
ncbi:hypothetical protein EJK51_0753 [Moraxella catarrhalis]|nr:hypothetical protein EJK52_0755 [Moraxella catarrhalis]AZQ90513.1 hypothetical protein EJK51_0753 [Moraxella catarrhalis]